MVHLRLTLYLVILFVVVSHGQNPDENDAMSTAPPNDMEMTSCPMRIKEGPYSYDPTSNNGPMSWGFLKPEYAKCATGMRQSPIDFPTKVKLGAMMNGPKLMLKEANMTFETSVYNWRFNCPPPPNDCGSTMYNGTTYYVEKIHFHRPSEHTLNGTRYPFEAHIVHRSVQNKTIALARLFNVKKETGYFYKVARQANFQLAMNKMIDNLLKGVKYMNKSQIIDLPKIMPKDSGFCSYLGSYTTPPCTEDVMFFMSMDIGIISRKQLHHFWASTGFSFDGNNRPTKPINGREVTCYLKPESMVKAENNMTMNGNSTTNGMEDSPSMAGGEDDDTAEIAV